MHWYFDFISPYAYLQSTRLQELASQESLECRPVLFAGLLDHWENIGPAEIKPKRDWTFKNAVWLAHRDGIDLTLPAHHPFNPLPLLRLSIALGNEIDVVQRLFRFVWAEGHLPTDTMAFDALLAELNTTIETLTDPNVKQVLLDNGKLAQRKQIFGVPTIEKNNELFWGYDATDMALAYGEHSNWPTDAMASAKVLPQGLSRKKTRPENSKKNANDPAIKEPTKESRQKQNAKPEHPEPKNKEPRIPYQPLDLKEPADLVNAIRQRRGGELIELDRLLLYSQPLAEGWNHFVGNIRNEFSVSHKLRELAMCTVAIVNRAEYEFTHHAPIYIKAGGSAEKAQALRQLDTALCNTDLFEQEEILTIALANQMTRDIHVDDALFAQCRKTFPDAELVELIATIAAYNMVSRFLVALNVVP